MREHRHIIHQRYFHSHTSILRVLTITCSEDVAGPVVDSEPQRNNFDAVASGRQMIAADLSVPKIRFCSIDDEGRRGQAVM